MSNLVAFTPENEIETLIANAKRGAIPIEDVLARLPQVDLFVSSKREIQIGGGFEPLLLGTAQSPLVAAFTAESRPALHKQVADYYFSMRGVEFFSGVPERYGVILNPGYEAQLILANDVVAGIRAE